MSVINTIIADTLSRMAKTNYLANKFYLPMEEFAFVRPEHQTMLRKFIQGIQVSGKVWAVDNIVKIHQQRFSES